MSSIQLVLLFILALPGSAHASNHSNGSAATFNQSSKSQARTNKPAKESRSGKGVDPVLAQKRSIAIGSLTTLAIEARSFRDEALRARVQARVADALWDVDLEAARSLFRRAWEAAEVFETQAQQPKSTAPGRVSATRPTIGRARTNLRAEILKLAAARDQALGDEFLKRLAALPSGINSPTGNTAISDTEIRERLRLANDFLESGNVERAIQFADPALVQVTGATIGFLIELRSKVPAAADRRFATLANRASADPNTDANTVSLLTRYAFTPWIDLAVSPEGIPSSNSYSAMPAPDLTPALKSAVLQLSANILLRPFAQLDQSSAGRAGTYFIAARLLPLFQQHAPELAPAISAQLTALGPEAARAALSAGDRSLNRGMTAETAGHNFAEDLKDRLERARNADERDRAYAFAAMGAAEASDKMAYDFLNKIEDMETRNGIRGFVDYSVVRGYLKKKMIDEAIALARKSAIPRAVRTRVLIESAEILDKTDRVRANEVLEEALAEARRIDAGTPERAYALVSLLEQFAKSNPVRAWELVGETVKAINADPAFTGENGMSRWLIEGKFRIHVGTTLAGPTDLAHSFAALAADDFYGAMDVARNFTGEAPRAITNIAVARAVLESNDPTAHVKRR